jgi:hypothetical protein
MAYKGYTTSKRRSRPRRSGATLVAPNKVEALAPLVCFGTEPHRAFRFGSDGHRHIRGKQWLSVVVAKTGKCSDGMN